MRYFRCSVCKRIKKPKLCEKKAPSTASRYAGIALLRASKAISSKAPNEKKN